MITLNYLFSILQYFSQDVFNITLIASFLFSLKYLKKLKIEPVLHAITVFILYGLILTAFVTDVPGAMKEEIYIYTVAWFLPFILGYCLTEEKHKKNIVLINICIFVVFILAGFLSYFGILPEKFLGIRFVYENMLKINYRWHVPFAAKCNLILTVSFTVALFSQFNKKLKILLVIFSFLIYFAILLSSSRLYFIISTFLFFIIYIFYIYKTKSFKFINFISMLFVLAIIFLSVYNYLPTFKNKLNNTDISSDLSLVTRINMYKYSFEMFKKYPVFGIGPAQATIQPDFYKLKTDGNVHTHLHSIYLHILACYGIIGLIIFLYIVCLILFKLYCKYKKNNSVFALAMIFAWTALLTADCFDFVLKNHITASLYFWFTGLALSGNDKNQKKRLNVF